MKKHSAFTLIELLIVIIIIGILAGMLMLATGSATDKAEATKIVNNMVVVKKALLLYYTDNGEWPENIGNGSGTTGKILVPLGNGTSGQVLKMSEISGPQWGTDNNTEYTAGTGLKLVNTQFSLDASGVTAAAYGNVNDQTLTWGITFAVPYIHVDTYGRIISAESSIITMPAEPTTGTIVGGTATDIANATATNGNVYQSSSGWSCS